MDENAEPRPSAASAGRPRPRAGFVAWAFAGSACLAMAGRAVPLGLTFATDLPMLALAVAGVIGAVTVLARGRGVLAGAGRAGWAVLAVAGWACLSTALSQDRFTALFGAPSFSMGLLSLLALLAVGLACSLHARRVTAALTAVAPWVLSAQLVATVYDLASGSGRPSGTLANSSFLGEAVVVFIPLVLAPVLSRKGAPAATGLARWALALSMVGVLYAGEARLALAVLVGELVVAALIARWREHVVRLASRAVAPLVGTGSALSVVATFAVASMAGRDWVVRTGGVIGQYWGAGVRGLAALPLAGLGPDGAFAMVHRAPASVALAAASYTPGMADRVSGDVHSAVLSIVLDYGPVGAVLIAWLVVEVAILWHDSLGKGGVSALLLMTAAAGYAVTTLICPASLETVLPFAMVAGVTAGIPRGHAPDPPGTAIGRWPGAALASVALVASLALAAHAATRLYAGPLTTPPSAADATRLQSAAELWRVDPFLYHKAATTWRGLLATDPGSFPMTLDLQDGAAAAALAPRVSRYATYQGSLMEAYRRPSEDVVAAYERGVALFPNGIDARLSLARYLVRTGRPADALPHAVFADKAVDRSSAGAAVLADVYSALGRTADAVKARDRAAALRARFGQ